MRKVVKMLFHKFHKIVTLCILFCLTAGCITETKNSLEKEPFDPVRIMTDAYSKVTVEDGIDHLEAKVLADAYFSSHISGCGATGLVIDQGDKWEVKTVFGYAATPYESIFIQKATGIITCKKGPKITPPSQELEANNH